MIYIFSTLFFAIITIALYLLQSSLGLVTLRKALGLTFFLEIFYLLGHYVWSWPFPGPMAIVQIFVTVGLGMALGALFSKVWPLPPQKGFERIMRTLLLGIPGIGLGIGLQIILQGNRPTQAIYLVFALAAWLGSGQNIRKNSEADIEIKQNSKLKTE